jgi:hypothetical protein
MIERPSSAVEPHGFSAFEDATDLLQPLPEARKHGASPRRAWEGPSSYVLLWALLAVRASGRNVDRRQHNEHAEDGVKHDARAVRCPGHEMFPFFQRVCPVVADIGGRAAPVCDLRHTFALLGAPFDLRRLPAGSSGRISSAFF